MDKYVCTVCGWVYDPVDHDNIAFADQAEDFVCPLCGADKSQFEKEA